MHSIYMWIIAFGKDTATFNSWIGILIYWVPVVICVIGYSIRTFVNCGTEYRDRMAYATGELGSFEPQETLGRILGRAITCFIPLANLGVAVFDFGATYLELFVEFLHRVFNQPLVPKLKSHRDAHEQAELKKRQERGVSGRLV